MTTLDGERLYLRKVVQDDVGERYVRWMNDPEITRFLESRFVEHTEASISEFVAGFENDPDNLFLAIVLREGDEHIGNIKLGPINRKHRFADIGIMLGERPHWGKGYASEAIAVLSEYALGELGLHKLNAGCYAGNEGSRRAFEKAGWTVEGVRAKQFLCEGEYVDEILLGRLASEE